MAVLKNNTGNTAAAAKFGGGTSVPRYTASKFVPNATWSVTDIDIRINEDTGSPHLTQNIVVKILGNTGTLPDDGTVLGTATKTGASIGAIGTTFTDYNILLSASLVNGVTYWIALEINTGGSDTNYWSSRAITTAAANNGAAFDENDTGLWVNNTNDLYYSLNGSVITTNIKTVDGLAVASVKTVNGLAIASVKTINGLA